MRSINIIFLSLLFATGFFYGQTGTTVVDSFQVNSQYRTFRLYVPAIYDGTKSVPLVLNLHGLGSNSLQQLVYSNFMPIADTAGFLIVHPDGTNNAGNQFWNVGLFSLPNDVLFLSSLIDSLKSKYNIDANAVYMCGMSNGGIMSYYFSCQQSGQLAAIASVAGTMLRPWYDNCQTYFATPAMEIHGTSDGTVPFNGNSVGGAAGLYLSTDSVIQKWRSMNQCDVTAQVINFPDLVPGDGSTAVNYRYLNGVDKSSVELIKVTGGSHSWPGAVNVINGTNQDFSASIEIWRFFRQYKRQQFTHSLAIENNAAVLKTVRVYPNPFENTLTIQSNFDLFYQLRDLQGRVLKSGKGSGDIDFTELASGFYFLTFSSESTTTTFKVVKR